MTTLSRTLRAAVLFAALVLVLATPATVSASPVAPAFRVLVFSKTTGFRHDSIPAGIAAIRQLGQQNNFAVDATEDDTKFTDTELAQYAAVVFLSSTASTANGTQVQLRDCGAGQANQTWTYTAGKQLMVYGKKCLDASGRGTANGTQVIIWACNGQNNQQWNVNANQAITGAQSNLRVDASGQGTANGTKIILWSCGGQANQQWALR